MSTITTIASVDLITDSRATINTNFSNLNTDKVEGQASSVDGEVALFSGVGGKTIKRASTTGIAKLTSGVLSAAVSATDYAPATSGSSILKGNGAGGFSSAVSSTDYAPATSGSAILKGNGSGGFSSATAGTDYTSPSSTETMTNKRITDRVTTITSNATPTINTDNCDCVTITALATAITSMTSSLSGTPTNFQKLIFRIKDDGTGRAITWGASFAARGVALPTTTVANKVLTVGFIYNTVAAVWDCVASVSEA